MPRRVLSSIRWVDIAVSLAVLIVLVAAMAADIRSPGDREPTRFAHNLAIVLALLTLFGRRWPVAVLIATTSVLLIYYAARYPPVGFALPVAAALYSVADTGRWRFAAAWSALVLLLTYGYRSVIAGQSPAYLFGFDMPTNAAVMAGAIALGVAAHTRFELRAAQRRALAQVRLDEERAAAQRVEQERLLLARDLHDVLAHTVSVVGLHADVAEEALTHDDPAAALSAVHAIREASGTAMRDLRGTLQVLRGDAPESFHPTAGIEALPALLERARAAGITVHSEISVDSAVPSAVGVTVYRVVQEAITNVLRHSGAASMALRVIGHDDEVVVEVEDDGHGMTPARGATPPPEGGGHGLRGMTERVQLLGGTVTSGDRAAGGFAVLARIPI